MSEELAALTGTEKQIAWAERIRAEKLAMLEREMTSEDALAMPFLYERALTSARKWQRAETWIDRRDWTESRFRMIVIEAFEKAGKRDVLDQKHAQWMALRGETPASRIKAMRAAHAAQRQAVSVRNEEAS